ncbi:MAG: hypothetical protein IBX40_09640, partial [Methanosarcinales archaeon]|nr:hypothetical protein [Methanosarcinales archaeon]
PHTTRAGGADRDGHTGRVKARRGGGKAEEGTWGSVSEEYLKYGMMKTITIITYSNNQIIYECYGG